MKKQGSTAETRLTELLQRSVRTLGVTTNPRSAGRLPATGDVRSRQYAHEKPTKTRNVVGRRERALQRVREQIDHDIRAGLFRRVPSLVEKGLTSLAGLAPEYVARLRRRFDSKWTPEPNTGCHLWTAALNSSGYGVMGVGVVRHSVPFVRAAHRIGWLLKHGSVSEGFELDHLCRNRACVNPAHLEPVSHFENCRRARSA